MRDNNPVGKVVVLHPDQVDKLEKQFPPLVVTRQTTEMELGFLAGAHAVIKKLREGFTYG